MSGESKEYPIRALVGPNGPQWYAPGMMAMVGEIHDFRPRLGPGLGYYCRKGMRVQVREAIRDLVGAKPCPGPGVVEPMLRMIGTIYRIDRVCPDGDLFLGGWYFLPQWVKRVPSKSPIRKARAK